MGEHNIMVIILINNNNQENHHIILAKNKNLKRIIMINRNKKMASVVESGTQNHRQVLHFLRLCQYPRAFETE